MTTLGRRASHSWRRLAGDRAPRHLAVVTVLSTGAAAGAAAGALVAVAGPGLAIALVAATVGVFVVATMPGLMLAMYLLIPFYKGAVQPYLPIDVTVVIASANALQVVPMLLDRRARAIPTPGLVMWFGLAALVIAGTLWAPDQQSAFTAAANFGLLVTIPLGAACLRVGSELRYVKQLLWGFLAIGVVTAILGVANISSLDRLTVLGMDTINVAAAAMLLPLVGFGFLMAQKWQSLKVLVLALAPAAALVALASGSRGPVLTFLILMLAAGAVRATHIRVVRPRVVVGSLIVLATLVGVVTVASAMLPATALQRYSLFGSFLSSAVGGSSAPTGDTSSEARVRLIGVAFSIFTDHPLLGSGTAGFAALSPYYVGPLLADVYPHNSVMQFAAEYGVVGLSLFAVFVGLALTRRLPRDAAWTTARLLAMFFLLNSLLSNNVFQDRTMWGLLLLLLLARVVPASGGAADLPVVASPGPSARSTTRPWSARSSLKPGAS